MGSYLCAFLFLVLPIFIASVESASKGPRSDHFKTALMGVGQSPWTPNAQWDARYYTFNNNPIFGDWYLLFPATGNNSKIMKGMRANIHLTQLKEEKLFHLFMPARKTPRKNLVFGNPPNMTQLWVSSTDTQMCREARPGNKGA